MVGGMDASTKPIRRGDLVQAVNTKGATLWRKAKEPLDSVGQVLAATRAGLLPFFGHVDVDVPFVLVDHGYKEVCLTLHYAEIPGQTTDAYVVIGLFADYGYLVYWESLPKRMRLKHATTQEQNK